MNFARSLLLNRIGGQMAILIMVSLLAIHAVITAGIFLSHGGERWNPRDSDPSELVAAIRLISATAPDARARVLQDVAHAFPSMDIKPAASMPPPDTAAAADPRLGHIERRLGPGFHVAPLRAAPPLGGAEQAFDIAVLLPDGGVLTARLPQYSEPLRFAGPLSATILFIVISVTLLGIWATRELRTPLSGFARAAESFSLEGDVAALPERGPEEIRAVAKAFNRMRDRIRRLVDDRTRLLAAMGHDLRTPITRLRLRSEFVADEELRRQMLSDLDQMRAMTDDVLSFLRDGRARETTTSIDLASVLQTVCDQFADIGHDVSYQGPAHAIAAARPDDLQRAVTNLVDNAVRHGDGVVVRLTATDQNACIEVEDDGAGIPDARKDAMLEAFVRGDEARNMDERSGFGLGLSIARAIVEAHGGALTLHDRTPHGLIARIMLPAAPRPPLQATAAA